MMLLICEIWKINEIKKNKQEQTHRYREKNVVVTTGERGGGSR